MPTEPAVAPSRFDRLLQRFKRDGCALLVVGPLTDVTRRTVSRRLFGATDEDRYRVLVTPDGGDTRHLPNGGTRGRTRVVTAGGGVTRGGDACGDPDPDALRAAVEDAVQDVLPPARTEPGALRVGLTSMPAVLGEEDAVDEFVRPVADLVRARRGMAHALYPVARDSRAERRLRPYFDAVVEQRLTPDGVEERWHVDDEGVRTGWLSV